MRRVRAGPVNLREAPVAELPHTSDMWVPGAIRRVLAHDPATDAITYVSEIPVGYRRQAEAEYRRAYPSGRFEYHTCHEEGFILAGRYDFGGWYDWNALSYLNHPPTWVHPADQHAPDGARLFMKMSGPLDFGYLDIPGGWNGREHPVDPALAGDLRGVSARPLDPARGGGVDSTGRRWQRLWVDAAGGWTTWLVTVPPGWRGSGDGWTADGGDELFLLAGELRTRIGDEPVPLREGDYVCRPDRFEDGGESEGSASGGVAIRWTRGVGLSERPRAAVDHDQVAGRVRLTRLR